MSGVDWYGQSEAVDRYDEAIEWGLMEQERRAVEEHFTDPTASVLDIGCGAGRTTAPLARRGHSIIGVDASPPMIDRGHARFPDIELQVADAANLPFVDNSFEYALFSFNGIDYISPEERRLKALREVARVLEPEGVFVFSSHNWWNLLPPEYTDVLGYAFVVQHWIHNVRRGTARSRYRYDVTMPVDLQLYYISPASQRRQLRDCGFRLRTMYGHPSGPIAPLHPWPYYVAELTPDGPGRGAEPADDLGPIRRLGRTIRRVVVPP